jgi:peptidoglycan-associated lipoprotein
MFNHFIKSTFLFLALSSLFACQNLKNRSLTKETKNKQQEQKEAELNTPNLQAPQESFKPIEDEQQANEINTTAEQEQQEIEVPDRVLFGYDSSDISQDAKTVLDVQVDWLKSDSTIKISIEGHCDERGTREYNIALGEKRADSIKKYFLKKGISNDRMKVISYGKEKPAFFGTSEDILAKNRRAVLVVKE